MKAIFGDVNISDQSSKPDESRNVSIMNNNYLT